MRLLSKGVAAREVGIKGVGIEKTGSGFVVWFELVRAQNGGGA